MHTRKFGVWVFSMLGVFAAAAAAEKPADFTRADLAAAAKIRDRALTDDTAYKLIESLTTEVGARFPGSPGDKAAVAWGLREMERLGLSNVHPVAAPVPHWVRGEAQVEVLAPYPQSLPTLAVGGSVGTGDAGIEAETVMVENLDALAALPAGAVKDRIVFFNGRTERTRDGMGYARAVAARSNGPARAAALGAVGVVLRSISTSNTRFPHTGATRYVADVPRIPGLAISNPDADSLARQFATGKPVRLKIRSTSRDLPPGISANVVGEISGGDLAHEIVILGAHLDSWDAGVGALDDGAGVAIMMSVAKLVRESGFKPRRTLRVVLFANEESGSTGSKAYVAAKKDEIDRHVLGFEADFGAGPVWRFAGRVNPAQSPTLSAIHAQLASLNVKLDLTEARGGADLEGLSKLGMPILEPGLDGTNYFDVHHTANDTLAQVDPVALKQAVAAFAVSVWLGAQKHGAWERVTTVKQPRR